MKKYQVTTGVYYVDAGEVGLRILCGCPMDSVKHLMRAGLIQDIEDDQWEWQTGPNCILLADASFQNGRLWNLTEFPIMHMLYKQGMIIPEHPGFGVKPLVIGIPEQIEGQKKYLQYGVNGLFDEEIEQCSLMNNPTKELVLAFKNRFKYGVRENVTQFITFQAIENNEEPYTLAPNFCIVRLGFNVYLFQYKEQELLIDLSLTEKQSYEAPYNLDYHLTTRRDFSIIHSGEGNGWDAHRPCMSSILCANGKYYLIDAGPNIIESLSKLGISLNEIEGLFQTHTHDDHFAGLTTIIACEHRLKFYATSLVRLSVIKKLSALLEINDSVFAQFFDVHDLEPDTWTTLDGFEVLPVMSPHPIETNIFYFRKKAPDGSYRSYGHLADIVSQHVYRSFLEPQDDYYIILKTNFSKIRNCYHLPVNLKKIDANGGMVHGDPEDFLQDASRKIIFSHTLNRLSLQQQIMGNTTSFGCEDILIPSSQDYLRQIGLIFFKSRWPEAETSGIFPLLQQKYLLIAPGTRILAHQTVLKSVYLLLSGLVTWVAPDVSTTKRLSWGTFLGEESALTNKTTYGTYIASSYIKVLCIPIELFTDFVQAYVDKQAYLLHLKERRLLQEYPIFRQISNHAILDNILGECCIREYEENTLLSDLHHDAVSLVMSGMAGVFYESTLVETLSTGRFYGFKGHLEEKAQHLSVTALSKITLMHIPMHIFTQTPILLLSLLEEINSINNLICQTIRVIKTTNQNIDNLTL